MNLSGGTRDLVTLKSVGMPMMPATEPKEKPR